MLGAKQHLHNDQPPVQTQRYYKYMWGKFMNRPDPWCRENGKGGAMHSRAKWIVSSVSVFLCLFPDKSKCYQFLAVRPLRAVKVHSVPWNSAAKERPPPAWKVTSYVGAADCLSGQSVLESNSCLLAGIKLVQTFMFPSSRTTQTFTLVPSSG